MSPRAQRRNDRLGSGVGDSGEAAMHNRGRRAKSCRGAAPKERDMTDAAPPETRDIGTVEDRFFTIRDFPLANGTVMPEATIAYETYGRLAPQNGSKGAR